MLTVTISGSLMYLIEGEEQPTIFSSIPAAMWWAIETLTTVGYGDMVPTTVAGRFLGGVVSVIGIGTLALFSGLITIGFLDQLKLHREQRSAAKVAQPARADENRSKGALRAQPVELTDLSVAMFDQSRARPGVCPHCGVALPHWTAH